MTTIETQPFILEELTVGLTDKAGNHIDRAYSMDIPVLVEFDYDAGSKDGEELPQLYRMRVTTPAGAVLQGERTTVTFQCGAEVTSYLTATQEMKLEEVMLDRMAKERQAEDAENRVSAAIADMEDKGYRQY